FDKLRGRRLRLVAPSMKLSTHNTLSFASWVEIELTSSHVKPISDERCQLFTAKGKIIEKRTNAEGVARFDRLPYIPPKGTPAEDTTRPAVVFPDIVEEQA